MKFREKLKLWLPALVWAVVIFTLSSMEINKEVPFSWSDFVVKKTAHVVEYAILYFLLWRAISNRGEKADKKIFYQVLALTIFYAFTDEWHQTFVPGRGGTLRDVGFDSIGAMLAMTQIKRNL